MANAITHSLMDARSSWKQQTEAVKAPALSAALDTYSVASNLVGLAGTPIIATVATVAPDTFNTFADWMNKGTDATVDALNDSKLSLNAKKASFQLATDIGIGAATL